MSSRSGARIVLLCAGHASIGALVGALLVPYCGASWGSTPAPWWEVILGDPRLLYAAPVISCCVSLFLLRATATATVLLATSLSFGMSAAYTIRWWLDGGSVLWEVWLRSAASGPICGLVFSLIYCLCGGWRKVEYPPLCRQCGYSLRGLAGTRCPECGSEVAGDNR